MIPIVREFYANAFEHDYSWETIVRGKTVCFDSKTINDFLRLPTNDNDEYQALRNELCEESTWDRILTALTPAGTQWIYHGQTRIGFPFNLLTREKRVWLNFLCANLTPSGHLTTVNIDKAVLLYSVYLA